MLQEEAEEEEASGGLSDELESLVLTGDGWTAPAGLQEAARVFLGDSSTAAFQISNCACNILPHLKLKKKCTPFYFR